MKTTFRPRAFTVLLIGCWLSTAYAEGESEFLLFLSADNVERGSVDEPAVQMGDFTPTADALFSYHNGPWRVLGEYLLTDDESELERLQLGYEYSDNKTVWFGRFHQPASVWHHRYHHGAYLQPSITRPSIENWEDENGVIPAHVTGLLLDAWQPLGDDNGFRYAASIGAAPILVDGELLPFDILDPDDGGCRPGGSINIAYFPDYVGETNAGLVGSYFEILGDPHPLLGVNSNFEIRQTILGAQINWGKDAWQLLAAVYHVNNDVSGTNSDVGGSFISAYAQALRTFGERMNGYVRLERTQDAEDVGYLRLYPLFVYENALIGLRYNFAARQAFNLEFSRKKIVSDEYSEFRIQWSAVFP